MCQKRLSVHEIEGCVKKDCQYLIQKAVEYFESEKICQYMRQKGVGRHGNLVLWHGLYDQEESDYIFLEMKLTVSQTPGLTYIYVYIGLCR